MTNFMRQFISRLLILSMLIGLMSAGGVLAADQSDRPALEPPVQSTEQEDGEEAEEEALTTEESEEPETDPEPAGDPAPGEEPAPAESLMPEGAVPDPVEDPEAVPSEDPDQTEEQPQESPADTIAYGQAEEDPRLLGPGHPTMGAALAQVAQEEFDAWGGTACGGRYWTGNEYAHWSADFIYWCGALLGYVGADKPLGEKTSDPAEAVYNMYAAGATVYYPGDRIRPEPGDILVWWAGGYPGTYLDQDKTEQTVYMSVVTEYDAETDLTTAIGGNYGSWDPMKATLARQTFSIEKNFGGYCVLEILRPDYPRLLSLEETDRIHETLLALLYGSNGGYISCEFDGYTSTDGRHEGIDCTRGAGAPIFAVISGELTRVAYGPDGSLSTIAIYDEKYDRTVVYLHANPSPDLRAGTYINRGDYLGTEGTHGCTAAHTHIEVVNGRSYYANVSVGDYYLDNESPYRYWAVKLSDEMIRYGMFYMNYDLVLGLGYTHRDSDDIPVNPMPKALVDFLAIRDGRHYWVYTDGGPDTIVTTAASW